MVLTADGRRLVPYARRVVGTLRNVRELYGSAGLLDGHVSIGTTDAFAAVHLPEVIVAVRREHPHLGVSIDTRESHELVERVARYQLDAAFVETPVDHPELDAIPVRRDPLALVAAHARSDNSIRRDDEIIVFPRGCGYRAALERWFAIQGWTPARVHEFRGVDAILGCTAAGLGVTAVPRSILNDSRYPLREIGTDLPPAVSTAFWVTRRDAQNVPTVAALTRLAVEMASTDRGVAQTP